MSRAQRVRTSAQPWLNVVFPPEEPLPLDPGTPGGAAALSERAEKIGMVMVLLYAQTGSIRAVADLTDSTESVVRHWIRKIREQNPKKVFQIADRLRGDVAQLAVDRVTEGLVEGPTEFAAELGRKILTGLGELQGGNARGSVLGSPTTLSINFGGPALPGLPPARDIEIIDGAVLGRPRDLEEEKRAAARPAAEDDGESENAAGE